MLWFLIQPKNASSNYQLAATDLEGSRQHLVDLGSRTAMGLTTTANGVATAIRNDRWRLLEFGNSGILLRQIGLPCYGSESLISVHGNPATICGNGTITEHRANTAVRYPSWARPGAIAENLSDGLVAIIDQATGKTVLNDIASNGVVVAPGQASEIDRAAQQIAKVKQQLTNVERPGSPVMVMDAAHDSSGWFVLIWPYNENFGPSVVKFNIAGAVQGQYRCRLPKPPSGSVHRIEVLTGNRLVLGSVGGDVFEYAF